MHFKNPTSPFFYSVIACGVFLLIGVFYIGRFSGQENAEASFEQTYSDIQERHETDTRKVSFSASLENEFSELVKNGQEEGGISIWRACILHNLTTARVNGKTVMDHLCELHNVWEISVPDTASLWSIAAYTEIMSVNEIRISWPHVILQNNRILLFQWTRKNGVWRCDNKTTKALCNGTLARELLNSGPKAMNKYAWHF